MRITEGVAQTSDSILIEDISRDPRTAHTDLADIEGVKRLCQRVTNEDPARELYRFVEPMDGLYLTSVIMQGVKS